MKDKGFTLVELLAVIVVLAIIMVIAIPNIMKSMDNSRRGTFKVYAQKVFTKAEEKWQSDQALGRTIGSCYSLDDIGIENSGNYKGQIIIGTPTGGNSNFTLYLSDGNFALKNVTLNDLNNIGLNDDPLIDDSTKLPTNAELTCNNN